MSHVRQEIIPRVAMMVYVDETSTVEDVGLTLDSFYDQNVPPHEVVLIWNVPGQECPPNYVRFLMNHTIKWHVDKIKGANKTNSDILVQADYGESVDMALNNKDMTAVYYTACKAGYVYPAYYIDVIDKAINEKMIAFIALLPDEDGNGVFVQRQIHKMVYGNSRNGECFNVIDKLKFVSKAEGTETMIKTFDELRESMI